MGRAAVTAESWVPSGVRPRPRPPGLDTTQATSPYGTHQGIRLDPLVLKAKLASGPRRKAPPQGLRVSINAS